MSDEQKTYTLEDMREAFYRGARWCRRYRQERCIQPVGSEIIHEAARRYPKPKRLREVEISGYTHRCVGGKLEIRVPGTDKWKPSWDESLLRAYIDLLEHPYEDDNS